MKYESYNGIINQSEALRLTLEKVNSASDDIKKLIEKSGDVIFIGCGSSYWLSISASKTFALMTGRRTYALTAGDVLMNFDEHESAYTNPILICPSRSGSSSEQLEAIKLFSRTYNNVSVLSATIYENSDLEAASHICINIPWADEKTVCQTRAFNCLYTAMLTIACCMSEDNILIDNLIKYIKVSDNLIDRDIGQVRRLVDKFPSFDKLITLGSGRQYGVAIEGAYIGIEMAQFVGNYYSTLEFRHGPIVTVNENTLAAIVSNTKSVEFEQGIARNIGKHGGKVLAVVNENGFKNADWIFELGAKYPPEITVLHFSRIMQVFAYYQALRTGLDPDHPGDLVPFIKY